MCIPAHLLWEYDLDQFDYDRSRSVVIIRVVQRGDLVAWRSIVDYYGKEEILLVTHPTRQLEERDKRFVRIFLDSSWVKPPPHCRKYRPGWTAPSRNLGTSFRISG